MAKLYFSYASMNAGKSTLLLQASYNYRERGMHTILLTAAIDRRAGEATIASRIGVASAADTFGTEDDLFERIDAAHKAAPVHCVLLDEAQFLTEAQVWQLACVADDLSIPIMAYGLRTDFRGELFPGSKALLAIADELREIRTICSCGRKATMVVRLDEAGQPILEGDQVDIGGNEKYVSYCRRHWREIMGR